MTAQFNEQGKRIGVYVDRCTWGQKYLFASISIPGQWIEPGAATCPE